VGTRFATGPGVDHETDRGAAAAPPAQEHSPPGETGRWAVLIWGNVVGLSNQTRPGLARGNPKAGGRLSSRRSTGIDGARIGHRGGRSVCVLVVCS